MPAPWAPSPVFSGPWTPRESTHAVPYTWGVKPARRGTGLCPTFPAYFVPCCSAGLAAVPWPFSNLNVNPLSCPCPPHLLKHFQLSLLKHSRTTNSGLGLTERTFRPPSYGRFALIKSCPPATICLGFPHFLGTLRAPATGHPGFSPYEYNPLPGLSRWSSKPGTLLLQYVCLTLTIASGLMWVLEDSLLKWKCVWP